MQTANTNIYCIDLFCRIRPHSRPKKCGAGEDAPGGEKKCGAPECGTATTTTCKYKAPNAFSLNIYLNVRNLLLILTLSKLYKGLKRNVCTFQGLSYKHLNNVNPCRFGFALDNAMNCRRLFIGDSTFCQITCNVLANTKFRNTPSSSLPFFFSLAAQRSEKSRPRSF